MSRSGRPGPERNGRGVTGRTKPGETNQSPELYRRLGAPALTLTCGGSFDHDLRSYRENVVVEAGPL